MGEWLLHRHRLASSSRDNPWALSWHSGQRVAAVVDMLVAMHVLIWRILLLLLLSLLRLLHVETALADNVDHHPLFWSLRDLLKVDFVPLEVCLLLLLSLHPWRWTSSDNIVVLSQALSGSTLRLLRLRRLANPHSAPHTRCGRLPPDWRLQDGNSCWWSTGHCLRWQHCWWLPQPSLLKHLGH